MPDRLPGAGRPRPGGRARPALLGVAALTGLLLGACASGSATAVVAATAAPQPSGSSVSAPATPRPAALDVVVTVTRGAVSTPSKRVVVRAGSPVHLVVTSDVADQVHVHGADLYLDLEPGVPGTLDFSPTAQGVFPVELHETDTLLVTLQVT